MKCSDCGYESEEIICPNKGVRVLRSFHYQGCVFKPGFTPGSVRVFMPCLDSTGLPVFDRAHFIEDENPVDLDPMLEVRDFETNQVLGSLNGYVSPICGRVKT